MSNAVFTTANYVPTINQINPNY